MRGRRDEPLVNAFVEQAERDFTGISQEQLDQGWQRLSLSRSAGARGWAVRQARPLRVRPWLAAFAVTCVLVLAATFGYRALTAQPLRYTVDGLVAQQGGAIAALPDAASQLLFSDESRVVLDPSTRLTVDSLDTRGARIRLLDGAADVFVKPRANGSWLFSAGPFLVRVTGTSFRLTFAASLGRLGLQMKSGHVEVFSPPGRTVAVGAGESIELLASPPSSAGAAAPVAVVPVPEDTASALDANPAPTRPRGAADSPRRRAVALLADAPSSPRAGLTPTAPSLAWAQWLRQGRFAQVVADAERRGIDQIIAQAGPADLAALADAARYIKRYSLSRQVLLAMRSRFAATESANDASFFLGRLAEVTSGAEPALAWYDTYLRDAPRGLYAKEAMGREMRLRAAGPPDQTRRIARQYLERFPQGPEADLARALVGAKPE